MLSKLSNIVLRVIVTLCAAAHLAAVMPHHHHDGSDVPCMAVMHCVAEEDHGHDAPDGCCGHDHDGRTDGRNCTAHDCAVDHLTVTGPRSEHSDLHIQLFPAVLPAHEMQVSCPLCGNICFTSRQTAAFKNLMPPERFYTACIIRTVPGRAPTA